MMDIDMQDNFWDGFYKVDVRCEHGRTRVAYVRRRCRSLPLAAAGVTAGKALAVTAAWCLLGSGRKPATKQGALPLPAVVHASAWQRVHLDHSRGPDIGITFTHKAPT